MTVMFCSLTKFGGQIGTVASSCRTWAATSKSLPIVRIRPRPRLDIAGQPQTQTRKNSREVTVVKTLAPEEVLDKLETKFNSLPDHRHKGFHLYVGTGQYFQDQDNDRLIFLALHSLPDNSKEDGVNVLSLPETILDCCMNPDHYDKLMKSLENTEFIHNPISTGELDFIGNGDWSFGFSVKPSFSLFSRLNGIYSSFVPKGKTSTHLRVCNNGLFEDIPIQDISSVNVSLSPDPWNERTIDLELHGGELLTILDMEVEGDNRDLSSLMIDTEWLVVCAGLLCLNIRKALISNVTLKLPRVLTTQGNPWVEVRQKAWIEFLKKYGHL